MNKFAKGLTLKASEPAKLRSDLLVVTFFVFVTQNFNCTQPQGKTLDFLFWVRSFFKRGGGELGRWGQNVCTPQHT